MKTRKTKRRNGKGGRVGCGGAVIKGLLRNFRDRGFLGNRSRNLRLFEFSATARWSATWAFAQPRPVSPIISTICYGPPNVRRPLRQVADLSANVRRPLRQMFADLSANVRRPLRQGSPTCQPSYSGIFSVVCFSKISSKWLGDCVSTTSRFLTTLKNFFN